MGFASRSVSCAILCIHRDHFYAYRGQHTFIVPALPPSIHILHARLEIRNINLITILKVSHSIAGGVGVRISWCCFLVVMGNGLATWTEWTRQFRDCKVTGKFTKENTKKEIGLSMKWTPRSHVSEQGKGNRSRLAISKWTHWSHGQARAQLSTSLLF